MEAAVLKDVNLSHIPSRYSPALRAIQKDALKVTVLKSDLGFEAVLLGLPDVTKSAECLYGHHCHSLWGFQMHSSASPLILIEIGDAVGAMTNITLVFFWLMCRLVCIAKLLSRLDFSWRWWLWVADMTARSSAKSRSSKHENGLHWIPRGRSDVVLRTTQSITTRNKIRERMQPCLTPDLTGNDSVRVYSTVTLHLKCSYNVLNMMATILCGIPYALKIVQRLSRWTLSNAFLKTMKLIYKGTFHSIHCSMMFRKAKIWSMQPRPFRNPACSYLNLASEAQSILLRRTLQTTLLGMDRSVMPRQLSQLLRSPFFGILDIRPILQSLGMLSIRDLNKEISKQHGGWGEICLE